MGRELRIAIVAGETSGDLLGADLIRAIKARHPDARFEGIGGPQMLEEGFVSHFSMERLAVMGLVEPLKRLPELLRIRRELRDRYTDNPPDLFLGIDSPDFNLDLERALRRCGVKTAHYVSPSVWAWRQGRIKTIGQAVDLMLTLFPFEEQFYQDHKVPVVCVGHPLADRFPMQPDQGAARKRLGFSEGDRVVALMPGSRGGEVRQLGSDFLKTARWCLKQDPDLKFVLPAANSARREQLEELLAEQSSALPLTLLDGDSHSAMCAADVVLMASGTTTLEAMLLKRPMVVAYRMAPLSYAIISRLVKSPYVSLPNLLAGKQLVPEILQNEVQAETLGPLLMERLQQTELREQLIEEFSAIHTQLRRSASDTAAEALISLIERKG